MKGQRTLSLILAMVLSACGGVTNKEPHVDDLLRFANQDAYERLHHEYSRDGRIIPVVMDPYSGRSFVANDESLAEGGVSDLVNSVAAQITSIGASMDTIEEDMYDPKVGYSVNVLGETISIWSQIEIDSLWHKAVDDESPSVALGYYLFDGILPRGLAIARAVEQTNKLLDRARVVDRMYIVGGGEDATAVLLTPDQLIAFNQEARTVSDRAYTPSEVPPDFGWSAQ